MTNTHVNCDCEICNKVFDYANRGAIKVGGRIKVDGRIDSENTIRVSDDFSNSSAGVEVSPTWSSEDQSMHFRITLLEHKDDEKGVELVWDGFRLMKDGACVLASKTPFKERMDYLVWGDKWEELGDEDKAAKCRSRYEETNPNYSSAKAGIEFRVRHDFGVMPISQHGIIKGTTA